MAPDEEAPQRSADTGADPAPTGDDVPNVPAMDPAEFVEPAPMTNGGEPAPPESFGIAGDPEAAAPADDPRGDDAPEADGVDEPSA